MSGEFTEAREQKERLVKTARMYSMCEKAGLKDPGLAASLALAAFEELPLEEAVVFVRANRVNIEDLAWAFARSGSAEEFEEKLHERLASMGQRPGRSGGRQSPPG